MLANHQLVTKKFSEFFHHQAVQKRVNSINDKAYETKGDSARLPWITTNLPFSAGKNLLILGLETVSNILYPTQPWEYSGQQTAFCKGELEFGSQNRCVESLSVNSPNVFYHFTLLQSISHHYESTHDAFSL